VSNDFFSSVIEALDGPQSAPVTSVEVVTQNKFPTSHSAVLKLVCADASAGEDKRYACVFQSLMSEPSALAAFCQKGTFSCNVRKRLCQKGTFSCNVRKRLPRARTHTHAYIHPHKGCFSRKCLRMPWRISPGPTGGEHWRTLAPKCASIASSRRL
jgi:hypothetical protein